LLSLFNYKSRRLKYSWDEEVKKKKRII
jgi:hypothetical protein